MLLTRILGGTTAAFAALALFLYVQIQVEKRAYAKLETRLVQTQAEYDAFAVRVKAKADELTRKAAQLALDTERKQTEISNEVSADYQQRLAALRARYDRLRAEAASGANPGGAGGANLPPLASGALGPDAAAADYRFRCEADALQLEALQRWVREQGMAPPQS